MSPPLVGLCRFAAWVPQVPRLGGTEWRQGVVRCRCFGGPNPPHIWCVPGTNRAVWAQETGLVPGADAPRVRLATLTNTVKRRRPHPRDYAPAQPSTMIKYFE